MAFEEDQSSAVAEMRPAIDCLRGCTELATIDTATLEALAAGAVHFSLPAGNTLFEQGATPDGVYLLVSGRLGVKIGALTGRTPEIEAGDLVGATVVALRDSELLYLPEPAVDSAALFCSAFSLAMARLCARRLQRSNSRGDDSPRARVFVIVPNSEEVDVAELATQFVAELAKGGRVDLVWDVRASLHTSAWFSRMEAMNDYMVYVADPSDSRWTRQCCRQADVILVAGLARAAPRPWPRSIAEDAVKRRVRIDLALLHEGCFAPGSVRGWLESLPVNSHHHLVERDDLGRLARLVTRRGVGLVLSGGGARGFAHLGVIQALREARVPIDFVGGSSIGSVVAAGVAMGWSDEEMQLRYRRSFVASNPVNDYTFPWIALTRGRKVSRLLVREYGDATIEELRVPFFCISANLTTGRAFEHRRGRLSTALRASVSLPGIMPPVVHGDDVLVDGAAINNLPVDIMQRHAPGLVIGSDVCVDRAHTAPRDINIFKVLVYAGMVSSAAGATMQRQLADLLLKPPLANIDLLNWSAFDRAIALGYAYARQAIETRGDLPRLRDAPTRTSSSNSLAEELERRLKAPAAARSGRSTRVPRDYTPRS
jgi:NTE family protein